jgi:hypothetical protein
VNVSIIVTCKIIRMKLYLIIKKKNHKNETLAQMPPGLNIEKLEDEGNV